MIAYVSRENFAVQPILYGPEIKNILEIKFSWLDKIHKRFESFSQNLL